MSDSRDTPTISERPASGAHAPGAAVPDEPAAARYASGDEIARGGMGRVIEATDTLLGRTVAIKEALSTDADLLRRFRRETQITARLEHPSIVPVYDAGNLPDGSPYYVMRKVTGRPLDQAIDEAADLDARLALLSHLVAAAQAVAHAHARGVIHRDLKPTNILIGAHGETVVIDWGLAKVIGEPDDDDAIAAPSAGASIHTRVGTMLGTPGFMPPEQIAGEAVDERADVYALGATLYYLLACRPPHASSTGDAMIAAAAKGPPAPVGTLVAGVPAALIAIVDKALAYDDAVRYRDAGLLAEDLRRFVAGQLVAAHHYTRGERFGRWFARNRRAVAVGGVALVLIGVGATVAVSRVVAARDDALTQATAADQARAAAEQAGVRERTRADELAISRGEALLATDPAAAILAVAPLADSPHWRDVRDLAAAARARGVAWQFPASSLTSGLAASPDGRRAVSIGEDDGVVRVYDTIDHTTRRIATREPHGLVRFVDNDHVVLFGPLTALAIVDLTSLELRVIDREVRPTHVSAHAGVIWYALDEVVYRLGLHDPAPTAFPLHEVATAIEASPDGTRALVGSAVGLSLVVPGKPNERVAPGVVHRLAWSTDGELAVAEIGDQVLELGHDPDHPARALELAGTLRSIETVAVAILREQLYVARRESLLMEGLNVASFPGALSIDACTARGDLYALELDSNRILVHDGGRLEELALPNNELTGLACSPGSPNLFAAARDEVVMWNLDRLFAHRLDVPKSAMTSAPYGDHGLAMLRGPTEPSLWVDLATGATTPGPVLDRFYRRITEVGTHLAALPGDGGDLELLAIGTAEHATIAHRVQDFAVPDAGHLALVLADDRVVRLDVATRSQVVVATAPHARAMVAANGWIAIRLGDHTVIRISPTDRAEHGTFAASNFTLGDDGRVWFPKDDTIQVWNVDGTIARQATLPTAPLRLVWIGAELIASAPGISYRVELDAVDHFARTVSLTIDAQAPSLFEGSRSASAGLLASPLANGDFAIVDTATWRTWPIARHGHQQVDVLHLTRDGRLLYAASSISGIRVMSLDYPSTQDTIRPWLDATINVLQTDR